MSRLHRPIVMLLGAALLASCDESPPAAPARPATAAPAAASAATAAATTETAAAPAAAKLPEYLYNPTNKRDPFMTPGSDIIPSSTENSCDEPLCKWELDELKLVGVVSGDANPVAMVQDPSGVGYVLRRDTKIGKKRGRVTKILRNAVVVTEYFRAPDGKENPTLSQLKLPEDGLFRPVQDLLIGGNR